MTPVLDLELSALEFEVLWEHLRLGDKPTELNVLSHGTTDEERAVYVRRAWEALEAKERAEDGRLDVELEDLLCLLARPERSIDLRLADQPGRETKGLIGAVGDTGAVGLLTGQALRFGWVRGTGLGSAAAELLPPPPPGRVDSVTVPAEALADAVRQAPQSPKLFARALASHGVRVEDAAALFEVGDAERTLFAQFGANVRDQFGKSHRASGVLNVFDIPLGRCATRERRGYDGRAWATFFGADHRTLVEQLDKLLHDAYTAAS